MHCPECGALLWATNDVFPDSIIFVRAGNLEDNEQVVPDGHYFVRSKHPWITIPDGVRSFQTLPGPDDAPIGTAEARRRFDAATKGRGRCASLTV
jgi:hypothetical protein